MSSFAVIKAARRVHCYAMFQRELRGVEVVHEDDHVIILQLVLVAEILLSCHVRSVLERVCNCGLLMANCVVKHLSCRKMVTSAVRPVPPQIL